ncbi:MAG: DUF4926 domain-containing protein [Anaerolineae bacterium]|jgi:hypothetical protein|nr:DUF4926 domain-containing protein [Anaerolineae bacterium]
MIQEYERVAITIDLPQVHLKSGDIGTVVDITSDGAEYTLEFFTLNGETYAVVPVLHTHIRRIGQGEVAHARPVETIA